MSVILLVSLSLSEAMPRKQILPQPRDPYRPGSVTPKSRIISGNVGGLAIHSRREKRGVREVEDELVPILPRTSANVYDQGGVITNQEGDRKIAVNAGPSDNSEESGNTAVKVITEVR
jgi:hypothetical protein